MEHKVIVNLRAVNGDNAVFRHWRRNITTALGRIGGARKEIVHRIVKYVDLGKELEKVAIGQKSE